MIKEVKMYTLICDRCGKDVNEDCDISAWSDIEPSIDNAYNEGWCLEDDKHYCPNCYDVDDDGFMTVKDAEPARTTQK